MASEVELERMVVRIVGDAQNYQQMLKQSVEETRKATSQIQQQAKGVNILGNAFSLLSGKGLALAGTLGLLVGAKEAFSGFAEAESISIKLNAALESNGRNVEKVREDYDEFAKSLAKVTTAEDDTTLRMLQVTESLGLTDVAAKRAVKNAVALAAAKGGEASSYLRVTAALEQGSTEMLGRFLPALRSIEDPTERATAAQEMLAKMFGVAKAEAGSSAGQMTQLKNEVGNLAEEFGGVFAQALKPVISGTRQGVAAIQEWIESIGGLDSVWDSAADHAMAAWDWIGPVRQAIGSLWEALVEGAQQSWQWIQDTALAVWDSIGLGAMVSWEAIRDTITNSILTAEFALRNFGQVAELLWTNTKLGFVIFANEVEYFFKEALPAMLTWFSNNWREIFTDVWNFSKTIFTNIVENIGNLFGKIWAAVTGENVDWSEGWKGLTQGFQRASEELVLPDRVKGDLERELEELAASQGKALSESLDDFIKAKREAFEMEKVLPDAEVEEVQNKALDLGTNLTDAFKPPRKEAEKLKESYQAAVFGSAEALQRIQQFRESMSKDAKAAKGSPEQRDVAQRSSPEANQRMEKQTKELEKIRNLAQQQLNKPTIVVEPANFS